MKKTTSNNKLKGFLIKNIRKFYFLDLLYLQYKSIIKKENFKHKEYKTKTIDEYSKYNKNKKRTISNDEYTEVFVPEYINISKEKVIKYRIDNIYLYEFNNISVLAETPFLIDDDKVITNLIKNSRIDLTFGPVWRYRNDKMTLIYKKNNKSLKEAISFCGFAANNYYHFTFEIISRLIYLNGFKEYEKVPLIFDKSVKDINQFQDILSKCNKTHEIIYIDKYEFCYVEKLIYVSENVWMPINIYPKCKPDYKDFLISKSAVKNIRSINSYNKKVQNKYIYISRENSNNRRIVNENEVIELFKKYNFEIIQTEDLSYKEQVDLFSTSKCIVGATGAAFTNVVYCVKNTLIGNIIPDEYKFCLYSTIAYMCGCKCLFFSPKIVNRTSYSSSDKYFVEIDKLEDYINELLRRT